MKNSNDYDFDPKAASPNLEELENLFYDLIDNEGYDYYRAAEEIAANHTNGKYNSRQILAMFTESKADPEKFLKDSRDKAYIIDSFKKGKDIEGFLKNPHDKGAFLRAAGLAESQKRELIEGEQQVCDTNRMIKEDRLKESQLSRRIRRIIGPGKSNTERSGTYMSYSIPSAEVSSRLSKAFGEPFEKRDFSDATIEKYFDDKTREEILHSFGPHINNYVVIPALFWMKPNLPPDLKKESAHNADDAKDQELIDNLISKGWPKIEAEIYIKGYSDDPKSDFVPETPMSESLTDNELIIAKMKDAGHDDEEIASRLSKAGMEKPEEQISDYNNILGKFEVKECYEAIDALADDVDGEDVWFEKTSLYELASIFFDKDIDKAVTRIIEKSKDSVESLFLFNKKSLSKFLKK